MAVKQAPKLLLNTASLHHASELTRGFQTSGARRLMVSMLRESLVIAPFLALAVHDIHTHLPHIHTHIPPTHRLGAAVELFMQFCSSLACFQGSAIMLPRMLPRMLPLHIFSVLWLFVAVTASSLQEPFPNRFGDEVEALPALEQKPHGRAGRLLGVDHGVVSDRRGVRGRSLNGFGRGGGGFGGGGGGRFRPGPGRGGERGGWGGGRGGEVPGEGGEEGGGGGGGGGGGDGGDGGDGICIGYCPGGGIGGGGGGGGSSSAFTTSSESTESMESTTQVTTPPFTAASTPSTP